MAFQPTNNGYDTNALKKVNPPRPNGWLRSLIDKDTEVPLWVSEYGTGFSMSGSVGQSPGTRTFFPRNMNQQQFTVLCEFPNQEVYAETVEFIRRMQKRLSSSLLLQVVSRVKYSQGARLKGSHKDLAVEGYVITAPRAHEQFNYAPTLQFDFIAERIHEPSDWGGEAIKMKMLTTWRDVIEDKKKDGAFVPVPEEPPTATNVPSRVAPDGNGGLRPT